MSTDLQSRDEDSLFVYVQDFQILWTVAALNIVISCINLVINLLYAYYMLCKRALAGSICAANGT